MRIWKASTFDFIIEDPAGDIPGLHFYAGSEKALRAEIRKFTTDVTCTCDHPRSEHSAKGCGAATEFSDTGKCQCSQTNIIKFTVTCLELPPTTKEQLIRIFNASGPVGYTIVRELEVFVRFR